MTEDEIEELSLGDVFFYDRESQFCCVVSPQDVQWKGSNRSVIVHAKVLLFLDFGFPQYVGWQGVDKSELIGPKSQDEINMWRMLNPQVDFTYWRKLYGKE